MWSKFQDVPVHGDPLSGKPAHTTRIYFENVDGFIIQEGIRKKKHKNNYKQSYLSQLLSRLDVDICGGAETRLQWDLVPKSKSLRHQLGLREGARCCTGHNVHERFGRCQQGGTFMVATEQVGAYVTTMGADKEGLGRWCWMKLVGQTVTTRVIVAYQPCSTRKQAIHATMAQQRRYWRLQGDRTCPRKLFRRHLVA